MVLLVSPLPSSYCEDSLSEPISTLLWVAPRLCAEIQELSVVSAMLALEECYSAPPPPPWFRWLISCRASLGSLLLNKRELTSLALSTQRCDMKAAHTLVFLSPSLSSLSLSLSLSLSVRVCVGDPSTRNRGSEEVSS